MQAACRRKCRLLDQPRTRYVVIVSLAAPKNSLALTRTAGIATRRRLEPSEKRAPVLSGKAEPLGPANMVWPARRAPAAASARGNFFAWSGWTVRYVASSREHCSATRSSTSSTAMTIVGWATAEWVGRDSGAVRNRLSSWRRQSSSSEPLANQDQGLGQW